MSDRPSLEEAKRLIRDATPGDPPSFELAAAAEVLARACEDKDAVSIQDLLRCLDFPGLVSEVGARCLYVRTGREDLGWRHAGANGLAYRTDKQDWLTYLATHGFI